MMELELYGDGSVIIDGNKNYPYLNAENLVKRVLNDFGASEEQKIMCFDNFIDCCSVGFFGERHEIVSVDELLEKMGSC